MLATESLETPVKPGLVGFEEFCEAIDQPLESYQRRIARAFFGKAREIAAVLPRGNAKTTLAAMLGLHHLITVPGASVVIGAASVQQARICFERMEGFISFPDLEDLVVKRHLELRFQGPEGIRRLRVIPSDGPRTHGLSCTVYIADELWTWSERADLLTAMQTGLVKRSDSKLLMISTSSGDLDSPLGRLRQRAMAQSDVHRAGPVVESKSRDLHWLEWSLGEAYELDDFQAIKKCNPAPWISIRDLRRQSESVSEGAFAQFHCCRWGVSESSWLPPGAWEQCRGETEFEEGERIWIGIDVGGTRSATAVVWLNEKLHVGVRIFQGDDAVFDAGEVVMKLAERFQIVEINFDPWRAATIVKAFEQRGITCTKFPWSDSRAIPAASALYDGVVEKKIVHSGDSELDKHVATAIARQTRRGWRIDKANESDQIDGVVSLAMALEAATAPKQTSRVLGWL